MVEALPSIPKASCRILIDGLLSALSHLAGLRILHRDVKPENLLLQTGQKMLAGFWGNRWVYHLALHEGKLLLPKIIASTSVEMATRSSLRRPSCSLRLWPSLP